VVKIVEIPVGRGKALGIHVQMPGEGAHLLVVRGDRGFIMCGYLNVALAEEVGDAAAMVRGVNSIEDVLERTIVSATSHAQALGVVPGMPVRDALAKFVSDA
jgi:uncharacterized protein YunC (DUF1805 family)